MAAFDSNCVYFDQIMNINTLNKQIFISLSLSVLVACAGSSSSADKGADEPSKARSDCISRTSIRGYSVLDDSNLIVESSGRRHYHLTLRRPARGLRSTHGISFDSSTGRVCARFSDLVFRGTLGPESVNIELIRELNEEQHEDLLIRYGKKEPEIKQTPVPRDVEGAEVEELDPAAESN